ncbi:unnamed protein product [Adineta steineri]|uniref:Phytanoyl-CoA dioxygenase n=1 Tax=Adineta steineri TaxID=433720 RepID=A0A814ZY75_9BILA|nr:unnamed protein product [Adineta steineri]CAF1533218.1 unnamed protein product [Adineta steineri]
MVQLTKSEQLYKEEYSKPDTKYQTRLEDLFGKHFNQLAIDLSTYGIVVLKEYFSGDALKQMQIDFNGWCTTKKPDVHNHIQFDGTATSECYLTKSEALSKAITEPLFWALGAHCWGRDPKLAFSRGYRIGPINPIEYRAFRLHNDGHYKELKIMILLTDVPEGGQSMYYWPGTHNIDWNIHSSRDTLFTKSDIQQIGESIECCGPAGSVFIFNTYAIHKGTRTKSRTNDMTRDTLVFNITGGKREYPIPPLHENVQVNLTDFEKYMFRVKQEDKLLETDGEMPMQAPSNIRDEYFMINSEYIKKMSSQFQAMMKQFPWLTTIPIPYREIPCIREKTIISTPLIDYHFPEFIEISGSTPNYDFKEILSQDLHSELDLPIREFSGLIDRQRDLALGDIRDRLMKEKKIDQLAFILSRLDTKTVTIGANFAEELPNQIVKIIDALKISTFTLLENNEKPYLLDNYRLFAIDLKYCLTTADSYALMKSSLAFILGILMYLQDRADNMQLSLDEQKTILNILTQASCVYLYYICHHFKKVALLDKCEETNNCSL